MTLEQRLAALITRLGTEFKALRTITGALVNLTTTTKTSLVDAINEVKAATAAAGAQINDAVTAANSVWSSSKVSSEVDTRIAVLTTGAPTALNTLDELSAALGDDANFGATVTTALGNRLRVDIATQGLTLTQQQNGRTNLNATGAVENGNVDADLVALFNTAIA